MNAETVPAAAPLTYAAPEFPTGWLSEANQPALPPPYPFTAYDLGEILKPYEPPLFLTKRDAWRKRGTTLRHKRGKTVNPLVLIAIQLLQKLPEVRVDQHGRKVAAGVALWL